MKLSVPTMLLFVWAVNATAADAVVGTRHGRDQWSDAPPSRSITVTGGRCVGLSRLEAEQLAQEAADRALLARLGELAEQMTARRLSARHLWRERFWLLEHSGVHRHEETAIEEKPYGFVAETTIAFTAPESTLGRWAERLAEQQRRSQTATLAAVAATLLLWAFGLMMLVRLDRATGGYYRGRLAAAVSVLVLALTGLGWWMLLLVI